MLLTLQRRPSAGETTIGELSEQGVRLCYTLEDMIREIPGRPVSEWKIHGRTAIPAQRYRVTLEDSPRFGPATLTLWGVPGFTGVRMHAGNTHEDTEGCPLLGLELAGSTIKGGTSRPAVALVKQRVGAAQAAGELVWMDILNPRPA